MMTANLVDHKQRHPRKQVRLKIVLGKAKESEDGGATCRPVAGASCTSKTKSHESLNGNSFALQFDYKHWKQT